MVFEIFSFQMCPPVDPPKRPVCSVLSVPLTASESWSFVRRMRFQVQTRKTPLLIDRFKKCNRVIQRLVALSLSLDLSVVLGQGGVHDETLD